MAWKNITVISGRVEHDSYFMATDIQIAAIAQQIIEQLTVIIKNIYTYLTYIAVGT